MKITKSKLIKVIRETFYNHPELGTFKPKDQQELDSMASLYSKEPTLENRYEWESFLKNHPLGSHSNPKIKNGVSKVLNVGVRKEEDLKTLRQFDSLAAAIDTTGSYYTLFPETQIKSIYDIDEETYKELDESEIAKLKVHLKKYSLSKEDVSELESLEKRHKMQPEYDDFKQLSREILGGEIPGLSGSRTGAHPLDQHVGSTKKYFYPFIEEFIQEYKSDLQEPELGVDEDDAVKAISMNFFNEHGYFGGYEDENLKLDDLYYALQNPGNSENHGLDPLDFNAVYDTKIGYDVPVVKKISPVVYRVLKRTMPDKTIFEIVKSILNEYIEDKTASANRTPYLHYGSYSDHPDKNDYSLYYDKNRDFYS